MENLQAAPANVLVPRNLMPATGIDTNSLGLMAPSYASVLPSSPFASPNSGKFKFKLVFLLNTYLD